ncbi:threonine/serine dehydratase [Pseudorhodobacter sp. MZDSW-24AT]|uniref:threonine ammonia-lyase n=1 Tax=Pseudorhodobacter sp. MZDSW-24AT TaxID=2052957 RepID=UPI000C1E7A6C|nr:threonine/serine dehydratase [Pseudorhodobacter sp. MZDSW-24AT]PJF11327.1 threonine ammonia-lyase [Pseudorhodobacter sp. MZDSW-24AT]
MNLAKIEAAAARLAGAARATPLLEAPLLSARAGKRVLVKAECLQVTGSFKFRGAWAAVSALPAETRGVLAYSSGNHGQGVALAAARHGLPCVVVMPSDAPEVKAANTRAFGAEVVLYDRQHEDRDAIGARLCAERGLALIKPFDDAEVIAGQGSVGLEIAAQARALGVEQGEVLVCCGGGGLSAGIALALEAHAPGLRLRTVEPAGFDDMARSLAAGERLRNAQGTGSVCDAILTPSPGELTFPVLQRLAGAGIAVSDDQALEAMALAFTHLRIVLEPGGAVALAAALKAETHDPVICVASGGNVDPGLFRDVVARFG